MDKIALYLNRASSKKVYVANNTLWIAYSPGSGTVMPNFKSKTYITTKSNDKNFDDIAHLIVEYSKTAKPDVKKKDSKLFKIPMYADDNVDVFNKEPKPYSFVYMLVNTAGVPVINFFKRKGEAMSWMKSEVNA